MINNDLIPIIENNSDKDDESSDDGNNEPPTMGEVAHSFADRLVQTTHSTSKDALAQSPIIRKEIIKAEEVAEEVAEPLRRAIIKAEEMEDEGEC